MSAKRRKAAVRKAAAAAARGPVVRKIWSGRVTGVSYPSQTAGGKVNNRYAKLALDLEGADKATTYYSWLDKGWLYDLEGMKEAAVQVQIRANNGDGTAKCYLVDPSVIKQHMLANKIPSSHNGMPAEARAVLQRTQTAPVTAAAKAYTAFINYRPQIRKGDSPWADYARVNVYEIL